MFRPWNKRKGGSEYRRRGHRSGMISVSVALEETESREDSDWIALQKVSGVSLEL